MTKDEQIPRFDEGNWVTAARLAVAASVMLSVVTAVILLMVDPPNQCPSWHLKNSESLWTLLALWTAPMIAMGSVIAIRWNWTTRKVAEATGRKVQTLFFGRVTPPDVSVTHIMINMCLVLSLASQLPLILLIANCTEWLSP